MDSDQLLELERQALAKKGKKMILSNNFQTFCNNIKIFLANSYLTMPAVFSQTGWLGGVVLYTVICLISIYSMVIIMEVTRHVSKRRLPNGEYKNVRTYSDLAMRI